MTLRLPSRSTVVTLVAITSLIGCLVFASVRLLQADNTLRVRTESTLWLVTQSQYEAMLFSKAMALAAAGEPADGGALAERHAILLSRVGMLLEGPQLRRLGEIADLSGVRRSYDLLLHAEAAIAAGPDRDAAAGLEAEATRLAAELRSVANRHLLAEREQAAAARDRYVRAIFEGMAAVAGIMVSAAALAWRLVEGSRETRRAESLLRQEQAFSDLVVNLSNQGILILDESRICLLWNPGMKVLFGLEGEGAVGRPIDAALPLFRSAALDAALEAAGSGRSCTFEEEDAGSDGAHRCLEISCHPLSMSRRRLVIVFVRDATERWLARKRAELHNVHLESEVKQRTKALHQAEDRLVAAIKSAAEGFAAFDHDGRLLIANERIRRMEPVAG